MNTIVNTRCVCVQAAGGELAVGGAGGAAAAAAAGGPVSAAGRGVWEWCSGCAE